MAEPTLLLGPVALRDFEVPELVAYGGKQTLAIHKLLGGARVVDALGRDDANIAFRGTFSGGDATERARALDNLRVLGQPLALIWDVFCFTVLIADFEAEFRSPWWIPFRVSCAVIQDESWEAVLAPVSLLESLTGDLALAAAAATQAGFDLSPQQAALTVPDAAIQGSSAYASARASLAAGCSGLAGGRDAAGFALETSVLGLQNTPSDWAGAMAGIEGSAMRAAVLQQANAYAGRAAVNLFGAGA